jgi:hypothetical protein
MFLIAQGNYALRELHRRHGCTHAGRHCLSDDRRQTRTKRLQRVRSDRRRGSRPRRTHGRGGSAPAIWPLPDRDPRASLRHLKTSFSQGVEWKALISRYIGIIPLSDDQPCAAEQSISGAPPPPTPVSSAMTAKVGAAASDSQLAAPSLSGAFILFSLSMRTQGGVTVRNMGERMVQSTMAVAFLTTYWFVVVR